MEGFISNIVISVAITICFMNLYASGQEIETMSEKKDKKNRTISRANTIELDNRIDENPDTCAQLNQVQGVVIQLLATHYENMKGMEILTTESNSVQQDIMTIKTRMDQMDTSQATMDERVKDITLCQSNITHLLSKSGAPISEDVPVDSRNELQNEQRGSVKQLRLRHNSVIGPVNIDSPDQNNMQTQFTNLSKTIQLQSKLINDFERQMRRIRRSISRLEQKLETAVSTRLNDTMERDIVRHFMEKQKDINGNMMASIRNLEEHFKEMTQSDAPSHNGGCPNGFTRHIMSCYRFANITLHWTEAENHCQALHHNAHLVGLETRKEEEYLIHFRNYNHARWTSNYIWIGATDMRKENSWYWVGTGLSLSYSNWRPGQPDIHNNDWQNCIYLRTDGHDHRWDDWHCNTVKLNFVCEINMEA